MKEEHHHHSVTVGDGAGNLNRAFVIGIWLNIIYTAAEGAFGFATGSMGLLSDAGHNLGDVASLLVSLLAYKAARRQPTARYTFGFGRATVDATVINALLLYGAVAVILTESISRLLNPRPVEGNVIAIVAAVGIVVNGVTALLLARGSRHDLNIKGAFLHMLADTLVSVGVVVSGLVISYTGFFIIDPIVGIVVGLLIAVGSYSLLRNSLRLSLDGVPPGIDLTTVEQAIRGVKGVASMSHLHVWALSTTTTALTVHITAKGDTPDVDDIICGIRRAVAPLGITHTTVEVDTQSDDACPIGSQNQ